MIPASHLAEEYDREKLMQCAICFSALDNPVQLNSCSHSFCLTCISAVPQNRPPEGNPNAPFHLWTCPECRTPYTPFLWQANVAAERMVQVVKKYENSDAIVHAMKKEHADHVATLKADIEALVVRPCSTVPTNGFPGPKKPGALQVFGYPSS